MRDILKSLLAWMIESAWFKKFSGQVGGFTLGVYVMGKYWRQINETLAVWGLDHSTLMHVCLLVVGASGVAASIGLQIAKGQQDKGDSEK